MRTAWRSSRSPRLPARTHCSISATRLIGGSRTSRTSCTYGSCPSPFVEAYARAVAVAPLARLLALVRGRGARSRWRRRWRRRRQRRLMTRAVARAIDRLHYARRARCHRDRHSSLRSPLPLSPARRRSLACYITRSRARVVAAHAVTAAAAAAAAAATEDTQRDVVNDARAFGVITRGTTDVTMRVIVSISSPRARGSGARSLARSLARVRVGDGGGGGGGGGGD